MEEVTFLFGFYPKVMSSQNSERLQKEFVFSHFYFTEYSSLNFPFKYPKVIALESIEAIEFMFFPNS